MIENSMLFRLACSILCPLLGCSSIASAAPLHDAAKEGDLEKIELLLAQGADINELTGPNTALHFAIQKKQAKAAGQALVSGPHSRGFFIAEPRPTTANSRGPGRRTALGQSTSNRP